MSVPFRRQLATVSRATLALGLLLLAHVVLKLTLFPQLAHAPVVGDEAAYVDGARALSNLVRDLSSFGPVDTAELQRNVVGSGWFMPGMSLLMTPLFVVDPDASITAIRVYLGSASTLLLVWTALSVRRVFGDVYAGILLVFPGLVPMWLLFSFAAWGDLTSGLLIVVLVTHLVTLFRSLRDAVPPTLGEGAKLGLIAVAVVYFRSSTTLVVASLSAALLIAVLLLLSGRSRMRGIAALGSAAAVFVAILLPWSVSVSQTLDSPVATTTSVPVVMANTFGDRDRVCFGECDPGSTIWFNPLRYSREVARATGLSEVDVQKEMSAYARSDVTAQSYARDVLDNLGRYVSEPAAFASYIRPPDAHDDAVHTAAVAVTNVMFFAMLGAAIAVMLTSFRGPIETQAVSIVLKLGLGALLTQPFVHVSGPRYWTSAAPLVALGAGLLWQHVRATGPRNDGRAAAAVSNRGLFAAQVALSALPVLVALALVACAI